MDCCKDFGVKVLLVLEALIPYTTDEIGTNFIIFTDLKIVVYLVIGTMVLHRGQLNNPVLIEKEIK